VRCHVCSSELKLRRSGKRDRSSGAVGRISNFVTQDSTEFGEGVESWLSSCRPYLDILF
jgi:hypothetical protein